jgi:SAM-dependent methyltransferase
VLGKNAKTNRYWEQNLVCPACKGRLRVVNSSMFCESCHNNYPIIDGVPCFVPTALDEHQKAELDSVLSKYVHHKSTPRRERTSNFVTPKWLEGKLDNRTVNLNSRIICLGGGSGDDVPHVKSDFKFNVDHLAHEYIKLSPEMAEDQTSEGTIKHIASTTEALPFRDNYADVVYSRNSLDHVNNPLKTMLEIHRVLKPNGRFYLSVFYNSNFIDCCETTIIDQDFVDNHLKNLFSIEWMELCPIEEESGHQPPKFSLPEKRKLEWLHAICQKKEDYEPYDLKTLEEYGSLTADFHAALYYDEILKYKDASPFYSKVLDRKPFLESDRMRILYSKIRYLAINDHEGFKTFFKEFKQVNDDPFWWKIVILSSGSFMKNALKKEVRQRFSGEEQVFLEHSIKTVTGLNFKRFVKNRKTIYRLSKPFYKALKKFMKNKDFFERTPF